MMKVIITNKNISNEFNIDRNFNKNTLTTIDKLILQDQSNTMIITSSGNTYNIFSKIIDIITIDIKSINELKIYLEDVLNYKDFSSEILNDLKLLIKDIDFNFEIISSLETEAGNELGEEISFLTNNDNSSISNEYSLTQRNQLTFDINNTSLTINEESSTGITDTSADEDNNLKIEVLASDKLTNINESLHISLSLSGVDSDTKSIKVQLSDGINFINVDAKLINGVWIIEDIDISSLNSGNISVEAVVQDNLGNIKIVEDNLILDNIKPNPPIILDIVDVKSDLSEIIISGSGDEVGNIIKVYDHLSNLIGTTSVLSNGTWNLNISSLSNDSRHVLKAVEIDSFLNISDDSSTVSLIKAANSNPSSLSSDDYIFTGLGNDIIYVNSDDSNNSLIIDGGEGEDYVSFENLNTAIKINLNDSTHIIGDDSLIFRNIENIYASNTDDNIIGDSQDNILDGKIGNDTLSGGIGNDSLYGQSGDDSLIGGSGDDLISGGTGRDIAVFSGNLSDYSFVRIGNSEINVKDNRVGSPDGTDKVLNVEFFQFADRLVPTARVSSTIDLLSSSDTGNTSDDITNDTSPTFKVDISPNVLLGYKVIIYSGTNKIAEHIVDSFDISNTYVHITTNTFTSDNTYSIHSSIENLLHFEGPSSPTLTFILDTSADSDNNLQVNILSSDKITNASESNDISITLSGIDSDALAVSVQFTDGTNSINKSASLFSGTWILSDTDISSLNEGTITVNVSVTDVASNVKTVSDTLLLDQVAASVQNFEITSIDDTNGDFSNIIISGKGEEVGNTITLYDEDNNIVGTTLVVSPGVWSINITNLSNTPINDNEFFTISETDLALNVSILTDSIHFNHYSWPNAQTDPFDDFALSGNGNDTLHVNDNDLNDMLVVDGGNGIDKLVFTGNKNDYTLIENLDGSITIIESSSSDSDNDGIGDITIAKNIEKLKFADGTFDVSSLVSPIAIDLNNDGIIGVTGETSSRNKELNGKIGKVVDFDIDGDGIKDKIEWFDGKGDGILIDNRDGNAQNDMDGSRLFGDEGGKYSSGYEKLALLDKNNDGKLEKEELEGLNVWIDDGDAILEEGELKTLKELNIKSISTIVDEIKDDEGKIHLQSTIEKENGNILLSEDVWFKKDNEETIDFEDLKINKPILDLNNFVKNSININFNELLNVKDENNEFIILGDKEDKIILEGGIKSENNIDGKWEHSGIKSDEEGHVYNVYQSSNGDSIVKLLIDNEIDMNNL